MNLAQLATRHVLLPAFETVLKRRSVMHHWRNLERSQWLPREQLEAVQFTALKALLTHAFDTCPHYTREWTRLGLHPTQLRTREDFNRWPVTDKDLIREHRLQLRSTRPLPLITKTTGGSTGAPLQFDLDHASNDRRMAAWHRGYGWAGAAPGTNQLHLWGVPIDPKPFKKRLKDRLYHALYRRQFVSCFDMSEGFATRFADELDRRRPDAIVAYTNPIYEVARCLEKSGHQPQHRPNAIVIGAEKIHPFQRDTIQRVFRAPVFETYGSREFMLIAAECESHQGLHLTAEHLLVELLDDHGQPVPTGTEGNVVITDLFNHGLPFIRYANGDRAIAATHPCPCGRGLPLLAKVTGRTLDMVRTPDGRTIPGEFFVYLLKDFAGVRRFQIIQQAADHLRVLLVLSNLSEPDRARLETAVRTSVGPTLRVDFEHVADIPLTRAGKLAVVKNNVAHRRAG